MANDMLIANVLVLMSQAHVKNLL